MGKGLFTTVSVERGELLVIFGGYIIPRDEEESLPEGMRDLGLMISPGYSIAVWESEEIGMDDYINHSCSPNCGIKGQIFLMAMREIAPGEEITFDYAMAMSETPGVP